MLEHLYIALALWIVTHTLAVEVLSRVPKPFSCQLCLAGWFGIGVSIANVLVYRNVESMIGPLAWWALSVLLEAVYTRLGTYIL